MAAGSDLDTVDLDMNARGVLTYLCLRPFMMCLKPFMMCLRPFMMTAVMKRTAVTWPSSNMDSDDSSDNRD